MAKIIIFSNKHRADDNRLVELEAKPIAYKGHTVVLYGNTDGIDISNTVYKVKRGGRRNKECIKQCLDEDGDLYIFQDPGLLSCAAKIQKRGKKAIFDSHENYEEKIKTRLTNRIPILKPCKKIIGKTWWIYEHHYIKQLSGKICADRTVLAKYGDRTFLLPNMPSKEFYSNLPEKSSQRDNYSIIYVGTITWDRGIIEAAEAIQLCKHENVKLQIIGDTRDEKLKSKLQAYPNVVWNGRVEWRKLKDYLVNADIGIVLLQPTEAYYYCPGENIVKLWEYMSVGLPVLLSDFPALRKLNDELKFGMTVKPDDVQEIANKIDWMLDNPEIITQMGKNGRELVSQKYNAENYTAELLKFLETIMLENENENKN